MNAPLSAAGYSQLTIYNIMLLLLTSTLRIMDAMQAGVFTAESNGAFARG